MDGTMTATVPMSRGAPAGGSRTLLGDGMTSPLDDDDDVERLDADDGTLVGVLSQVQHAYRRLVQSNSHFNACYGKVS